MIIGFGAFLSNAAKELLALVEGLQVPFVTTLGGKGIIREDHPLSLGILANSGNPSATAFFKGTDLVLAIGNSFSQNATFDFFPGLFQNKKLIHINIDQNEISKVYKADHGIVADAAPAISGPVRAYQRRNRPGRTGELSQGRSPVSRHCPHRQANSPGPARPIALQASARR